MTKNMWEMLILFWGSEEGKRRSKRNMKNWSKQIHKHAGGTKSIARLSQERINTRDARGNRFKTNCNLFKISIGDPPERKSGGDGGHAERKPGAYGGHADRK